MEGIFFIIFILIFTIAINNMQAVSKHPICQVHAWLYDEQGEMRCKVCGRRPRDL